MTATVYFGQDPNANVRFVVGGASQTAHDAFVAALQAGYLVEGFSNTGLDYAAQSTWPVANWGGTPWPLWEGVGSLTPSSYTDPRAMLSDAKNRGGGPVGRFDTTGPDEFGVPSFWWESDADFSIALGALRTAFGFYGTDFSDWGGTVTIRLFNGATQVGTDLLLTLSGGGNTNGGLLFWGVTSDTPFNTVRVVLVQTETNPVNYDICGFDDLIVGDAIAAPPPPAPPAAGCHVWPGGVIAV